MENLKRVDGDDFMFELTKKEWNILRSQFVTSSHGGVRYQPFAFTELGVAMLSSILNSDTAIDINRKIMRAFVAMRHLILSPHVNEVKQLQNEIRALKEYVEDVFKAQNDVNEDTRMQLELINHALAELQAQKQTLNSPRRRIGYRTNDEDEFI